MNGALETRAALELRVVGQGKLEGYAARFGCVSADLGGFTEEIRTGAFSRSLRAPDAIMALLEHDRQKVLGRVGAGTVRLTEDTRGLAFEIDLPPTSYGRDLAALVARGDVAGASFAFTTPEGGDIWSDRSGRPHRELVDVDLHEITITGTPAYPDTSVARRHLENGTTRVTRLSLALRLLELHNP